ncbi:MAG: hypothetical protein IJH65_03220 [Methanobrevibacter sp.]|nr:hypothetical protein [Methanobrevibacter sp.]
MNSDLIKERFANGGIFGQLCHPDYEEVDMEKVACVMPEPPVKDKDGQLVAYVDILDTPCGRIAYQLAKYGYKLGISSRGTGDLITGPNGEEEVDPDTYQLNAFDLVEIPAVESARLSFVESLDKKRYNKTLRQALTESLNKETDENKKIAEEALDGLGIKLDESAVQELQQYFDEWKEINSDIDLESLIDDYYNETGVLLSQIMYSPEEFDNFINWAETERDTHVKSLGDEPVEIEENKESSVPSSDKEEEEVVDDKSDVELVAEFQEALLKIKKLEEDNLSLQEQLSVGSAKEVRLNEELQRYKSAVAEMSDTVKKLKPLKEEVQNLKESLDEKDRLLSTRNARITSLVEARKKAQSDMDSITESKEELEKKNSTLTEELNNRTKELATVSKQLDSTKELVEKYRRSYKSLKENYVELKATSYGLKKEEVLKKLGESYKIRDIEPICEELSQYKTNMRKLPFRLTEDTKVSVKPSKNEYIRGDVIDLGDDTVTSSLLQLADIK